MARYPRHRRTGMWIGLIICWASLFGASYATKVSHGRIGHMQMANLHIHKVSVLVVLQGVTYAVGGGGTLQL